jgi:hypothetical protein
MKAASVKAEMARHSETCSSPAAIGYLVRSFVAGLGIDSSTGYESRLPMAMTDGRAIDIFHLAHVTDDGLVANSSTETD